MANVFKKGFSLIEMLVVISIIAVLAALLLPAISNSKQRTYTISCANNLKQLQVCWNLYSLDNNDYLVPNNSVYNLLDGQPLSKGNSWCVGNTRIDSTFDNIKNAMLFQYNTSVEIYHCAADKSTIEDSNGVKLTKIRTRSYNLSQSLNGYPEYDENIASITPTFNKLSKILNTSEIISFLDVHEDEIIDSMFGFPVIGVWGDSYVWWDMPANRHQKGCNFAFSDGHVFRKKWKVDKKIKIRNAAQSALEEKEDYLFIRNGIKQYF